MTSMSRFSSFTWAMLGIVIVLIGQEVTAFTPRVPTRAPSTLSSRSCLSCPRSSLALPSRAARMSPLASTQGDGNIVVGEDSGAFSLKEQSLKSWGVFGVLVSIVLGALFVLWINPSTGFGDEFIAAIESFSPNSSVTIALLLTIFGVAHSGLASLRAPMEEVIGARAWRVIFALTSLPLASSAIGYFINHRYDGVQLWDYRLVPGVHDLVWILSFVSFYFLYPSTFNLLEIAAVERPKLHMWATGIMRITRHPQMVGQGLWCFAHSLWMGNSFVLVTSVFLMLHHIFGVWNGDRRLSEKYGETFEEYKGITSVIPFQAIVEGRQELPSDYWKEFLRLPYLIIAVGTLGAYYAHPFMQAGAWTLHW